MTTYTLTVATTEGIEIITNHNTMTEVENTFAKIAAAGRCEWSEIANNETGETARYEY